MAVGEFRSIPFPPIKLERIINYIFYIGERGVVRVEELRVKGLEIGRGRGDITRFLQWLGIIRIDGNGEVILSGRGRVLLELAATMGVSAMHVPLYLFVKPYRVVVDELAAEGSLRMDVIRDLTPSLNTVSRRSLIRLLVDVGVAGERGRELVYLGDPVRRGIANCLGVSPAESDVARCVPVKVDGCVARLSGIGPRRFVKVDLDCVISNIYARFTHVD